MAKITVLQKENNRYAFIFDDSRESSSCGRYRIERRTLLSTGATAYTENTTKEDGNALYRELISNGFYRFRSVREVSWYATCPNNTPRKEEWKTEGIYLVPIQSSVAG